MTAVNGKQRTLFQTIGLVVVMGGLAWASVPFYDWFCRVTGFSGVTAVAIVEDRDAKYAKSITLSYTFYEIELPQEAQAALLQPERTKIN